MVGDGFCDDETNNNECNYDGGDCCLNVNTEHCEDCICHFEKFCATGFHPLVGDGYCNDETNIGECSYDGGDCCVNVNRNHCSECLCLGNGYISFPGLFENYDRNLDLHWLIQVPLGQYIFINELSVDIYPNSNYPCR